jgi:hypothetical protein
MEIPDKRHEQALAVQFSAYEDVTGKEQEASYWLALACCLLTSPVKAEREQGKALVKRWKYRHNPAD